jgi:hypothetical protein
MAVAGLLATVRHLSVHVLVTPFVPEMARYSVVKRPALYGGTVAHGGTIKLNRCALLHLHDLIFKYPVFILLLQRVSKRLKGRYTTPASIC